MKKKIIAILLAIEIVLLIIIMVDKKFVSTILEIDNMFAVKVKKVEISEGPGSELPINIIFKISEKNYSKYNLKYSDRENEEGLYDAEICNKKIKKGKNYLCSYQKVEYNKNIQSRIRRYILTRIIFKIISGITIIYILWYISINYRRIKNDEV